MQTNKAHLQSELDAAGASAGEHMLVTAMAMLETTDMDASQRDDSKDGRPSMSLSILNLNLDKVQQLGYQGDNDGGAALYDPANPSQAVALLLYGFRIWGVASTLNFQRGGSTAFNDGVSYGAADYRNVIASMYAPSWPTRRFSPTAGAWRFICNTSDYPASSGSENSPVTATRTSKAMPPCENNGLF